MPEVPDLAARVTALEARLAVLEERCAPAPARAPDSRWEEPFWALSRLEDESPQGALLYAGHVHLPTGEHWGWKERQGGPEMLAASWDEAAPVLAALGHPLRLAILRAVLHGQRTTTQLQAAPELATGGKLYHHLRELQAAGWLLMQGRGEYTVPAERVIPLLIAVRATGRVTGAES